MLLKLEKDTRLFQNLIDVLMAIVLGLSSFKLTFRIYELVDLILSDEPYYLYNGVNLFKQGFPKAEWSPFYAIWYWFLSIIEPTKDNLNLYYFNHEVLIALTTVLLFFALRSINIRRTLASVITFIYLLSGIPVIWPRPTHLVLALLLLFIIVQSCINNNRTFFYGVSILLLIVSFVRPEYFVSFIASYLLLSIYEATKSFSVDESRRIKYFQPLLLYSIFALFLIVFLGIPTASGNRSWWAFASHFALRWSWKNESNLDPWVDYEQITSFYFDDADTIFKAMVVNPKVFISYVLENIKGLFLNTVDILGGNLKDNSPSLKTLNPLVDRFFRWGQISFLIFAFIQLSLKYRRTFENIRSKTFIRLVFIAALVQVCILPSTILIFPRYHYLIVNSVMLLILFGYLYSHLSDKKNLNDGFKRFIIIGSFILFLTPTLSKGWCIHNSCLYSPKIPNKASLETVHFLRSLDIHEPVDLLAFDYEYRTFLGDHFNRISPTAKTVDFQQFRADKDIDMIIVRPALNQDIRFVEDKTWQEFLQQHRLYDYSSLDIPNTSWTLLIKDELLKNKV